MIKEEPGKTLTVLKLKLVKNPIVNCPSVFHLKSTINGGDVVIVIILFLQDLVKRRHEERCEAITIPLNMIVVPHTIFSRWENSIKTYTTIPHFAIKNRKTNDKFGRNTNLVTCRKSQIVLVTNKF